MSTFFDLEAEVSEDGSSTDDDQENQNNYSELIKLIDFNPPQSAEQSKIKQALDLREHKPPPIQKTFLQADLDRILVGSRVTATILESENEDIMDMIEEEKRKKAVQNCTAFKHSIRKKIIDSSSLVESCININDDDYILSKKQWRETNKIVKPGEKNSYKENDKKSLLGKFFISKINMKSINLVNTFKKKDKVNSIFYQKSYKSECKLSNQL